MRFREYWTDFEQELGEYGFSVLGGVEHWETVNRSECKEIGMELVTEENAIDRLGLFWAVEWENILPFVDVEELEQICSEEFDDDEEEEEALSREFLEHYPEILKGENKTFKLVGFQTHINRITLHYAPREGVWFLTDYYLISIENPNWLALVFTGPKTRLGFTPVYQIAMHCGGSEPDCRITEDSGLMRREMRLRLKDSDGEIKDDNVCVVVTEYADI